MKGFNFNISSLFSNLNNSGPMGSFNISDYNSIRNGSYGKLLKSYYAKDKKVADKSDKDDKTTTNKTSNKKLLDSAEKTELTKIKAESDGLKKSTEALLDDKLWKENDSEKITSAIKTFAKEYNEVLNETPKTTSRDIAQNAKFMQSMTSTMTKALSKVGITVEADGKLTVNEEAVKKADAKNVKTLFAGSSSYAAQIDKYAAGISNAAARESSIYNNSGNLNSSFSNLFDQWI